MKIPILGQTGESRDSSVNNELTQNWYPHIDPNGKNQIVLYPTPGMSNEFQIGTGPIRGMIEFDDDLYVISSNALYKRDFATDTTTLVGSITSTAGRVNMAHNGASNGKQIIIVDGIAGYLYDHQWGTIGELKQYDTGTATTDTANKLVDSGAAFDTLSLVKGVPIYNDTDGTTGYVKAVDSATTISCMDASGNDLDLFPDGDETYTIGNGNFPASATHCDFMDGRFIVNDPSTSGVWRCSNSYEGWEWDAQGFATAERTPDALQGLVVADRTIWLLGTQTAEAWYNEGVDSTFPYSPIQAGFSQWGCAAADSIVEIGGIVFWLSKNRQGTGQVIMTQGLQPVIVPNSQNITTEIAKMTTTSDAYGWAYQRDGHTFYVLTFPTEQRTFVYDLATQLWHDWATASTGYHRSLTHVFIAGEGHFIGDPINANIYKLDWDRFDDNGEAPVRIRRTQHIHSADRALRHYGLWIDVKEGVGTHTLNPMIQLRWRDHNGAWSSPKSRYMGKEGQTNVKCIWRMLGRSYDRVYEIKVTDAVNAVLIDGYLRTDDDERELG